MTTCSAVVAWFNSTPPPPLQIFTTNPRQSYVMYHHFKVHFDTKTMFYLQFRPVSSAVFASSPLPPWTCDGRRGLGVCLVLSTSRNARCVSTTHVARCLSVRGMAVVDSVIFMCGTNVCFTLLEFGSTTRQQDGSTHCEWPSSASRNASLRSSPSIGILSCCSDRSSLHWCSPEASPPDTSRPFKYSRLMISTTETRRAMVEVETSAGAE